MEILKVNALDITTKKQLFRLRLITTEARRIHKEHGGVAYAKEYFLSPTKNTQYIDKAVISI